MKPTAVLSPRPDVEPEASHRPDSTPSTLDRLDDTDLLHLLLPPRNSRSVAADLLARFGSLGEVMAADRAELARIPDVSEAVITTLKGLRELCVRSARHTARRRPVLTSWSTVRDYAVTALAHLPREQFRALYLDRRNLLIQDESVANGTIDHAPVYPREVVRRALEVSASALILIHNHPSGDPTPSQADIAMTRQIVDAARVFGLTVHDHLIVAREGTASFRALGLM